MRTTIKQDLKPKSFARTAQHFLSKMKEKGSCSAKSKSFYRKFVSLFWPSNLWPPSGPDLNPLDYAIWGALENKTNATSHPNIGALKTAIEEEWIKCLKNLF